MKRVFTFVAAAITFLALWADPVTKESARESAKLFLQNRGVEMSEESSVHRAPRKGASEKDNSYYYIFNAGNDQGYVIVSGDDRTEEILGYVEHGTYSEEALPEHMKSWLQTYADQIQFLIDNNISGSTPTQRATARRKIKSTKHAVPTLMTTTWNQGDPYNAKCPVYYKGDGTTAQPATGCVATALAQVMYYYKQPARIRKTIPQLTNTYTLDNGLKKTVTTRPINVGTKILWENMVDHYTGDETQEQKDAVGNLMAYVGQAVGMGYGPSSGAGFGSNVSTAFSTYFGYDDSAYMAYRSDYTIDEWFDLIYEEIAAGHPVGFAGWNTAGGHSFVLDGFDGESLFHLNWGWGGGSDGWFLLGVLNPGDNSGIGASTSSDGYCLGQTALMNVRTNDGVKAEPTACLTINDVAIEGSAIKGAYINWTGAKNSFHIGIVYQKSDGTLAPVGGKYETITKDPNYYDVKTYDLTGLLPEGTWKVSPASKLISGKVWRTKYNMRDTYIEAVVDASGNVTLRQVAPHYDLHIDTIKCIGTGEVDDEQEIQITFTNHGDEHLRELRLFASTSDVKVDADSRTMVALRKGETGTYSFYYKPTEPGVYNIWICAQSNGEDEIGSGQITIAEKDKGFKPNLSVSTFSIKNQLSGKVYGPRLYGTIAIRNNDKIPFAGKVVMQLWKQAAGSNVAYSSSTATALVDISPSGSATASFDFSNLEYGPTYRIQVKVYGKELTNGGLWEHGWICNDGVLVWKENGDMSALATKSYILTGSTLCAMMVDKTTVRRISPNKNPNTIYAINEGTEVPTGLTENNLVVGDSAEHIRISSGYAYYVPYTFTAKEACYAHTFPEEGNGKGWQTISLPFAVDSVFVDGIAMELNNPNNHFWIFEYAYNGDNAEPIFTPAEQLCGNMPYLIAADSCLAGKTIEFKSHDVSIFNTSSTKSVVSSKEYSMRGTSLAQNIKYIYVMNADGTAFDYMELSKLTTPTSAYFTTTLDAETRLASILLPEVPTSLDTAIEGTEANKANGDDAIYNIMGQQVGKASQLKNGTLPSGIYVSKGRTILVK